MALFECNKISGNQIIEGDFTAVTAGDVISLGFRPKQVTVYGRDTTGQRITCGFCDENVNYCISIYPNGNVHSNLPQNFYLTDDGFYFKPYSNYFQYSIHYVAIK